MPSFTVDGLLSRLDVATMAEEHGMGANDEDLGGIFTYEETWGFLQELCDERLIDVEYS